MAGMEAVHRETQQHGLSLTKAHLATVTAEFLSCQQQRHSMVLQYRNIPQESQSLGDKLVTS